MIWKDVKIFMNACDQDISDDNAKLYLSLIKEEFEELMEANRNNDDVERLDGCMDLIWVTLGYCLAKGYDVVGAWEEVTKSNFAKIDDKTGKVIKNKDGKVVKPNNWTPPNLSRFV
jgi:predicted HAD superfamily Cof-like phosphohydrolase